MKQTTMGRLIASRRKELGMTQKELARQLHISDKAVSKWERGVSCPDISLLTAIAEILGITVAGLLNGSADAPIEDRQPKDTQQAPIPAPVMPPTEKPASEKTPRLRTVCSFFLSLLLLIGIITCAVCDLAISGRFSWSLFPITSILFTGLSLFPVMKWGLRGIGRSLAAVSLLIFPFLSVLSRLILNAPLLWPIGLGTSLLSLLFLWGVFLLFRGLYRRRWLAASLSSLLAVLLCIAINLFLSRILSGPVMDIWDIAVLSALLLLSLLFFALDYRAGQRQN